MNILITGASGFIGSHILRQLCGLRNVNVYALVRNEQALEQTNCIKIVVSLSDEKFEDKLPREIDCIVHLAQSEAYRAFPEKASEIFEVNLNATQRLLNWGYNNRIKKFVFASSGNVYKQQNKLLNEMDACEPFGYYGATKYAGEVLAKPYSNYFELSILRIFGVYGPNQRNMTIPNVITKIKSNEELILANNEGLWFTPLYIDDCVEMINHIIFKRATRECNVYNIAGIEPISLAAFIQLVCKLKDYQPKIKITDDTPMYLMGDSSKFCDDFNFKPLVSLTEGLTKVLEQ